MLRIVNLESESVDAPFRRPDVAHEWAEFAMCEQASLIDALRGANIAVINKLRLDAAAVAALPELEMVAVAATGTDNIDLQACAAHGVTVCNVRGYAGHTVPEHVLMLMLALRRSLLSYVSDVHAGKWGRSNNFCLFGHPVGDLYGATLGIVGRGSLGQGVARLAGAFGMHVMYAERRDAETVREGYVSFRKMLAEADVVSLHCPLSAETVALIDEEALSSMRRDAVLINTARGALVDEEALAEALRAGEIAGAAIDVLSEEPPRSGSPLLDSSVPNLIVTPHMAWASSAAMQALTDQVIGNIEAYVAGRPRNRVV